MSTAEKMPPPTEVRTAEVVPFEKPGPGAVLVLPARPTGEALATMSDEEFERQLAALKTAQVRKRVVLRELLQEGIDNDYAVIPGTPKRALLKPGAEKLCQFHSLRPSYEFTVRYGDGKNAPHIGVSMKCRLHVGDTSGPVIAEGLAAGNSWERKHRYRKAERVCPSCGKAAVIKGNKEYGGGWLCWKKKDGCGAKWADGAAVIEAQKSGEIENTDPYDLENNIVKVTKKRAYIDATVTATATSDLLTQDLDENLGGNDDAPPPGQPAGQAPATSTTAGKRGRPPKQAAPQAAPEPARETPAATQQQPPARLDLAVVVELARERYKDFDKKITPAEMGALFATAKQRGMTKSDQLHPYTERLFGVSSCKLVPASGLDALMRAILGEPEPGDGE